MSKAFKLLLMMTTLTLMLLHPRSFAAETETLLYVTDIHFNPLADAAIVPRLIDEPVSKWNEIFASSSKKDFSHYREDTNYPLWQSALKAMKQAAPHPATVIVGGDFFRHTFRADFEKLYKSKADFRTVYSQFLKKTIQFLVQGLVREFPDAQFVPVIGNNDSTCGDYLVYLHDPFLHDFAEAWQNASQQSIPANESGDFATSGHYVTSLKHNSNLKIIVGNDIFLTPQYNGRCGHAFAPPALSELHWMAQQLAAAEKAGQKVWLITHVPPGVDVTRSIYKSMTGQKTPFMPMFKEDYNQKYLEMLHRHAGNILLHFTSHNHFGEIRIPGGDVAVIMAPSISPDKTNNPTFQVYDIDTKSMVIQNFTNYAVDLSSEGSPSWEKILDFDQAFQQKEVSLKTLKTIETSLNAGKLTSVYTTMVTSNGALAKTLFSFVHKAYLCGMSEMSVAAFQGCLDRSDSN